MSTLLKNILVSVFALIVLMSGKTLFASVMGSTNYSIESDSLNFGGGLSNSTNYKQESTFGEIATGPSGSTNYNIKAGYQQMSGVFLSMTTASDVTLSPSIPSVGGGIGNGSTAVTVTTDDTSGYELYIKASSSPALVSSSDSFADYTPAGANPDLTFSVAAATSEFAFSPEGTDIATKYRDDGSACNIGALDTVNACWGPLTTSNDLIANRASGNYPGGTVTTIKFRAESGASHTQTPGAYTATTTLTAIAL
jgi:hypothetical protein